MYATIGRVVDYGIVCCLKVWVGECVFCYFAYRMDVNSGRIFINNE